MKTGALGRFIAASGLTNFGDGVALVAWTWIASQLTRDPLLIALVPAALKAPWFLFSLPAGIVVDRMDRRRLILGADMLRTLAYLAAALAIWSALPFAPPPATGTDRALVLALIAACAMIVGGAEVLRDNAAQTILPALVDSRDLERANGRLWSVETVMNGMVGTAVAGVMLALSLAVPFGVNAAAMALAVALVAGLRGNFTPQRTDPRPWRAELRDGIAYLLAHRLLRQLAILTGLFNFAFEAMMVTLVLIVQERLQFGPLALSAILASGAVAGVAAGSVNHRIVAWAGRGAVLQWTMLVSLAFPLAVLIAPSGTAGLAVICVGFAVAEFGGVLWNTVTVSYRQRSVPNHMLGRVNSCYRLFAIGMAPLGMVAAGVLTRLASEKIGREAALSVPFLTATLIYVLLAVVYWRFLGRSFSST